MENWNILLWALVQFSILALVVERALYVIFEWKVFERLEDFLFDRGEWLDIKPLISCVVSIFIVTLMKVDMLAVLFGADAVTTPGMWITGLFVAGGSKAVFIMFKRLRELRDANVQAQIEAKQL